MRKLLNHIFLPCIKATELIEKRDIVPLSLPEKIQLIFHLSMCKACHAYQMQSSKLKQALKNWILAEKLPVKSLSKDKKTKIIQRMEQL